MDNITEKQSKSAPFGKISLIAGLSNILLLVSSVLLKNFGHILHGIIFFAFALSLSVGIGTGIVAFINKRVWIGLVINLLMLILLGVSVFIYFTLCCAPPPQFR